MCLSLLLLVCISHVPVDCIINICNHCKFENGSPSRPVTVLLFPSSSRAFYWSKHNPSSFGLKSGLKPFLTIKAILRPFLKRLGLDSWLYLGAGAAPKSADLTTVAVQRCRFFSQSRFRVSNPKGFCAKRCRPKNTWVNPCLDLSPSKGLGPIRYLEK